jgi:hypothetical protein
MTSKLVLDPWLCVANFHWLCLFGGLAIMVSKLTVDPWLCVPSFRLVCYYRRSGIVSTRGNGFRSMTLRTLLSLSEPFRSVAG